MEIQPQLQDNQSILYIVVQHFSNCISQADLFSLKLVCKSLKKISSHAIIRKVIIDILLNIPAGEVRDAMEALQGCVKDKKYLYSQAINFALPLYNKRQMTPVQSPGHSHQVLITEYGEAKDSVFIDPIGKQLLFYDHFKQEVFKTCPLTNELDNDVEPFRYAFEREALRYVQECYPNGATTVYGGKQPGKFVITVAISAAKWSMPNFWTGKWRSTWQITIPTEKDNPNLQAEIGGKIQIRVHYFEDGNIQLNTNVHKQLISKVGDPVITAENAFEQIIKAENTFFKSLEDCYMVMGDNAFKSLRRGFPIRRRWDWAKLCTYKIGSHLS